MTTPKGGPEDNDGNFPLPHPRIRGVKKKVITYVLLHGAMR